MSPSRHTFPYGVTLKFSCDEGFVLHGDAETQCMADGTWQPPLPSCVPVQCSLPAREVDVVFHAVKKMFEVNDILYSSCERDGYRLKNAPSICSADGTWIPPPKCKTLHTCQKILQIREAFVCGIPLTELKTLLEVQKLYLEIQKLEEDLRIRRRS